MNRIRLSIPPNPLFTTSLQVRITDINYGGHVGNDAILSMIHEIRVRFLNHFGYQELNFENTGLIMKDVIIEFKRECFYGDTITAAVSVSEFSRIGFDLVYHLYIRRDKENDQTVALAKTGMICFDYQQRKILPLPEMAKVRLSPGSATPNG